MGPYYRASAVSLTTADYARCQALYEGTQGGAAGAHSGGGRSSSCCGVCGPRYARLVQREGADSSVHVVERGADSGGERTPREVRENNIKVRKTPSVFLLHFPFSFSFLFSMIFFSTSKQVVCQDRLGTDSGLFMRKAQNNQPMAAIRRCCTGGLLRLAHAVVDAAGGAVPRRSRWLSALHGRKLIVSRCQSVRPSALTDCC